MKKLTYQSLWRVNLLCNALTALLSIAALILAVLAAQMQGAYPFGLIVMFCALGTSIIGLQWLRHQLCHVLCHTFGSILNDLPEKYTQPIMRCGSLPDAIEMISVARLEYGNNDMTTKYLLAEAELGALQGQINPHFLYNTLESICGLAMMQGAPQVAKMTETLAYMFRNSLRKAGMLVTLEEELTSVDHYMTIQQFRFSNKFSFHKHIAAEDEKRILACILPHFTLQPIVENAIYHGLEMMQGHGEIHLHAVLTQKRLLLKISDNGCGIPQQKLNLINDSLSSAQAYSASPADSTHVGMAMLNINLRIKKTFGNDYGISLYSTSGIGTDVNITLPCTWEKNFDSLLGDEEDA